MDGTEGKESIVLDKKVRQCLWGNSRYRLKENTVKM